jgi:hypothetical protein
MSELRSIRDSNDKTSDQFRPARAGLAQGSRLGIGATRLWYRDPKTGRVRPARPEDRAEDCFTTD